MDGRGLPVQTLVTLEPMVEGDLAVSDRGEEEKATALWCAPSSHPARPGWSVFSSALAQPPAVRDAGEEAPPHSAPVSSDSKPSLPLLDATETGGVACTPVPQTPGSALSAASPAESGDVEMADDGDAKWRPTLDTPVTPVKAVGDSSPSSSVTGASQIAEDGPSGHCRGVRAPSPEGASGKSRSRWPLRLTLREPSSWHRRAPERVRPQAEATLSCGVADRPPGSPADDNVSPRVIALLESHQPAATWPQGTDSTIVSMKDPGLEDTARQPARPPDRRSPSPDTVRVSVGSDDNMESAGAADAMTAVHHVTTVAADPIYVDVNNNAVGWMTDCRSHSIAAAASGARPERHDDSPAAAGAAPHPDGEKEALAAPGKASAAHSPLLVDVDIGRVFLTANRTLYGCEEPDASEASAARPGGGSDAEDDDEGRLYIALEPPSPDLLQTGLVALDGTRPAPVSHARPELGAAAAPAVGPGQAQLADQRRAAARTKVGRRRIREQDKPLQCSKCDRRFVLKKMLENHKCGVTYGCAECGKLFKKRCQLHAHSFIHKQVKDFVCEICQRAFKEKSNFNRHVRTHSSLRPYKCPHCVKCFKVAATLYVHRLTHDARGRFVCDFCGKDFKRPEHLRQHRRIHTGEKPYRCAVCEQRFTTDNTLRTHMRRHTGERPYPCPVCQKRFTQSSAMKTHWKRHSEEREFDCPACHLKFKQKYDLNRHMVSHNTERPHQCGVCHFCFKTRSSLQKHLETHAEGRQFACAACGKTFRRLSYLRLHESTHGDGRRFTCAHCPKSFTRRYNLRLHQEEHEEGGRRRHGCPVCRRSFRLARGLRQHTATAHSGPSRGTAEPEATTESAAAAQAEDGKPAGLGTAGSQRDRPATGQSCGTSALREEIKDEGTEIKDEGEEVRDEGLDVEDGREDESSEEEELVVD
ncbi:uncharacterized protein LOC119114948 [Pollicipes pollicipes]|uniref:uncharacterized protein LOC119114948 n=1 Tax=Pollicipes pollicipes TaxID=41117 RepID=UPI00188492A6|nr:uncharacterized protein LOC119114948 [Pollicipes pollicipes]